MDVQRVNYALEKAILFLQEDEVESLVEKAAFKLMSPKQMQKKHGMETAISAEDAMKRVDATLAPLTAGHGKLTDPNRTPSRKELISVLNELVEVSKRMVPKDRKDVLAQLRDWQKVARMHAKRMEQAAASHRVGDVGREDIASARNVRDHIGSAIRIISKIRGGGYMKYGAQTKAKKSEPKKEVKEQVGYDFWLQYLSHKLTRYDMAETKKETKRGNPGNIYRLGHLMKALDRLREQTKAAQSRYPDASNDAVASAFRELMHNRFDFNFPPVRAVSKAIIEFIRTGKRPKIA